MNRKLNQTKIAKPACNTIDAVIRLDFYHVTSRKLRCLVADATILYFYFTQTIYFGQEVLREVVVLAYTAYDQFWDDLLPVPSSNKTADASVGLDSKLKS